MELAEQSPTSSFADVNKLSCAIHPIPKSARTITVLASRRLRIIAIETDLFAIQAEILHGRRREAATAHGEITNQTQNAVMRGEDDRHSCSDPPLSARELTYCFLRLGNLDNGAFERLGRYNAALWKQTAQTLLLLGSTRRR